MLSAFLISALLLFIFYLALFHVAKLINLLHTMKQK